MLLDVQKRKIETDGVLESQNFGIVFNAKLVKILSDGLYSDKIMALLRELSANAIDAHTDNNKSTTPIEIQLPTVFDPTFAVRDYGKGLSPEQIKEVYTIYGESSKDQDNNAIGMLGLGSKTPFCYNTRSCTVESWNNGIKYTYTAYLNEEGMPVLAKINEEATTEPSGLKVTLAVNKNDIGNFAEKAKQVFRYYSVPPKFKGNVVTPHTVKYVFKGNGWALRELNNYNDTHAAIAVMGQIGYPIKLEDTNLNETLRQALGCKLDLFFNIGDLDIEASREGLSFDLRTKTNILKKVQQVCSEIEALIEQKIKGSASLWDARINFKKLRETLPDAFFRVLNQSNVVWNGKKLFSDRLRLQVETTNEISTYYARTLWNGNISSISGPQNTRYVSIDENIKFIDNDLKVGGIKRTKEWILANTFKYKVYVLSFEDNTHKQKWMEEVGILDSHLTLASSLPSSTVTTSPLKGVKRGHSTSVMKWKCNDIYKTKCWENTQYDLAKGGLYSEINNFDIVLPTKDELHPMHFHTIKEQLGILGVAQKDLLGIKSAVLPKVAKSGGKWNSLYELCETSINDFLKTNNLEDFLHAERELDSIGRYEYVNHQTVYFVDKDTAIGLEPLIKKQSVFASYISKLKEYKTLLKNKPKFDAIVRLRDLLKIKLSQKITIPQYNLKAEQKKVYDTYPLLRHFNSVSKSEYNHLAVYINNV